MNRRLPFPVVFCLIALLTSVSALAAWSSELNRLTSEEIEDGWLLLFDGESLYGWRPVVEADWKVDGGAIVVTSGKVGLLRTTTQFSDYILKVDFRAPRGTNAGVFLRTSPEPKNPARDCYEVNISDKETDYPTASLVGRKRAEVQAAAGEWHTFEIRAEGNVYRLVDHKSTNGTFLNDERVENASLMFLAPALTTSPRRSRSAPGPAPRPSRSGPRGSPV